MARLNATLCQKKYLQHRTRYLPHRRQCHSHIFTPSWINVGNILTHTLKPHRVVNKNHKAYINHSQHSTRRFENKDQRIANNFALTKDGCIQVTRAKLFFCLSFTIICMYVCWRLFLINVVLNNFCCYYIKNVLNIFMKSLLILRQRTQQAGLRKLKIGMYWTKGKGE